MSKVEIPGVAPESPSRSPLATLPATRYPAAAPHAWIPSKHALPPAMTPATYLTLLRILLVPVFAVLAIYYGVSVASGTPSPGYHWSAVSVFVVAALTDLADGIIARRYKQRPPLGAVLDPIADKLLILTAILILSIVPWGEAWAIPIWFVGLVIVRDAVVWGGIAVLRFLDYQVQIRPHWTGKTCTALLMVTVAWTGLKIIPLSPLYPTTVTAIFLVLATVVSIRQGIDQLHENDRTRANAHGQSDS